MSTASTTSSLLNSVLLATTDSNSSGLNVTSIVASIIAADSAPVDAWQAQQTTIAGQTSAINQLEVDASSLSDVLNQLSDPAGILSSVEASTSDSSIVTASALPGTTVGNHTVEVNNLATTGSWYSDSVTAGSAALSAGSFTINQGGTSTTVNFGGSGEPDTLDQLAASINGQSLGVTASVVTDSTGARLSLVADSTGTAADFTVSGASGLGFTQAVQAADASLTVDGVPITSASNTVTGALSGVTLNLQSASAGTPVSLTLSPDTTDITTAVQNFVTAYNQLITDVNAQFDYNSTTNTDGALSSDSVIRGLQSTLLSSTNYSADDDSTIPTLASLGVSTNQDGTLSLDTTTLDSAVANNFSSVTSFFQGDAQNGFAADLYNSLNVYTDPSEGAFTVDLQSLSNENQDLASQISTYQAYLSTEQTTLTNEYNQADIALLQLPQQIQQTQTLLGLNNSGSNNG